MNAILRRDKVLELTGLSFSTVRRSIIRGDFPAPVKLGPRAIGWRAGDIEQWLQSRETKATNMPHPPL